MPDLPNPSFEVLREVTLSFKDDSRILTMIKNSGMFQSDDIVAEIERMKTIKMERKLEAELKSVSEFDISSVFSD